jgi:hypothetical protein
MMASSHWTESERAFRQLAAVKPAALTLKTTSDKVGGIGTSVVEKRQRHEIVNTYRSTIGYHADGPKPLEFWNVVTTRKMSRLAQKMLPETLLGLSVLYGENYGALQRKLDVSLYSYVELNWKYTFRRVEPHKLPAALAAIRNDLSQFLDAFRDWPRFVKVPAEIIDLFAGDLFYEIRQTIQSEGGGLLVANTKKIRVPPSRVGAKVPSELARGVVFGDYLFLATFNLIRQLGELKDAGEHIPPIVATGGVTDIGAVVDVMAAGASAVQLCTALDLRGVQVIDWFREQLSRLADDSSTLDLFVAKISKSPSEWTKAIVECNSSAIDYSRVGDLLRAGVASVEAAVAECIVSELGTPETVQMPLVTGPLDNGAQYHFVITKGNIGSYLLSQGCARAGRFTAVELDDAREFASKLVPATFTWDFLIFPRSVVEHIQREGRAQLGDKYPEIIATVGTSVVEMVGDVRDKLEAVAYIKHFAGVSSLAAVDRFLETRQRGPEPMFDEVDAGTILPTLQYWRRGQAILAKHPLTRIYGLLTPREHWGNWGVLWKTTEDLVLASSVGFRKRANFTAATDWVLSKLATLRRHHLEDPQRSAHDLVTGGFLAHCARLLGGKVLL